MTASQSGSTSSRLLLGVIAGLVGLTFLVYFGVWRFGFVDYDDNTYIYQNPYVTSGLNRQNIEWAFTTPVGCHWIPLTWISHALDCELFGLNPAGHHVTSLLLHVANVVLVLLLFRQLTGSLWRSALVAALFGLHPLRVESVAWVAERKDVLSGFFFLLTLLAYAKYATPSPHSALRTPHSGNSLPWHSRPYVLAVVCFAFGLMSKPMLVTAPFVLLLLDFWPLNRLSLAAVKAQLPALLFEKVPFFVLAVVASVATVLAQSGVTAETGTVAWDQRLANGVFAYVNYLGQTIWPANLAVFYPPQWISIFSGRAMLALGLLLGLTLLAIFATRHRPFVAVGWFWFVGMLVPVSGIVQPGAMFQSDHFT